jgi:CBS domain-containing protein
MSIVRPVLKDTLLKDIMIKPVKVVRESDDFHVVKDKLETFDIRHLPVVDEDGILVGLMTQRHLFKIHSPRKLESGDWYYDKEALDNFILKNVMIKEPFTLGPNSTLEEAMQTMSQFKYGCVIVVDESRRPCGIVTRNDILKVLLTK